MNRSPENVVADIQKQKEGCEPILFYGKSVIGDLHIERGTVCQDYSKAVILTNGWCVAAVADGVGSAKYSEVASRIAVETVMKICYRDLTDSAFDAEYVKRILFASYMLAQNKIENYACRNNHNLTEYDTTLSCVVYDGKRIVYGHSGDGGIVGITLQGEYRKITQPQKASDGICVIPLRAGAKSWVIEESPEEFASLLLATDGIYDTFFPYLLKGHRSEMYIPLIRFFMDNNLLKAHENNISDIEKSRFDYICGNAYATVKDDKTIMVVINPNIVPALLDESYYTEPDWNALQEEWNRKAYPHMYKDKKEDCHLHDIKPVDEK